jgi:SNF2 family DNA or RNA helicase
LLVIKQHRKLLLNLADPDRVTTVMPTATKVEYKGQTLVAVPHREDEVRVLRNLGFDPPTPISTYYPFPHGPRIAKPFAHQVATAEHLTTNPHDFCLNGMGSGKTLSVLWAFDYLRKIGQAKRMLVLSPLSTLERAWGDEIFNNFTDMTFTVLHGDRAKRHKLLAEDFDVYIINHDGIKNAETIRLIQEREGLDIICIDEVASFRNAQTERWKALNAIINPREKVEGKSVVRPKKWVWGLTGTPTPNLPTDAWAQARLISPSRVPPYFNRFKEEVMRQISQFKWVPRDTALEIVKQALQPAIRFSREDCIDLPPTTYVTRQVDLSPDQTRAFNDMLRKFKAEHEGGQITAANEAVKLGKLVQICCGVAYGANDSEVHIPATARIELVREIIEEAGAKVLVFVPLTAALEHLAMELRKDFTVEIVHGQTPRTERDRIFREFQTAADPRVIVANPGTLSHGLTLTAADTIIWYAPINSNETFQQANARIVRPGQTRNTLIVQIEATDIERKMYARLQGKEKMQGLLLDLIKEMK